MLTECVLDSPVGRLRLLAEGDGLAGVFMEQWRQSAPATALSSAAASPILARTTTWLHGYFGGNFAAFEGRLAWPGTDFQNRVWRAVLKIPVGEIRSYADIAAAVGCPNGARAVGAAVGRNPFAIVVPCHRVVGIDGSLTGFGGGLQRKCWLLDHESGNPVGDCSIRAPRQPVRRLRCR